MHTISWNVRDNLGRADGIGSRYFNVLNAPAAAGRATGSLATAQAAQVQRRTLARAWRTPQADALSYRRGFDLDSPTLPLNLSAPVELSELERIEIQLPAGINWTAGLRVNGELRPLPVGSTLDAAEGVFSWQLGPGFLGEYTLEFGRPGVAPIPVHVRVGPRDAASESVASAK